MTYEVEQKFHVDDLAALVRTLRTLGCEVSTSVRQADAYLAHPARDLGATDEALRLRSEGEANSLTYKGPRVDPVTSTRFELELPLPDGAPWMNGFSELLRLLSFGVVVHVHKRRRRARVVWDDTEVEVSLDEVRGLGCFAELEAHAGELEWEAAGRRLASLANRLGLSRSERRNYYELLRPDR